MVMTIAAVLLELPVLAGTVVEVVLVDVVVDEGAVVEAGTVVVGTVVAGTVVATVGAGVVGGRVVGASVVGTVVDGAVVVDDVVVVWAWAGAAISSDGKPSRPSRAVTMATADAPRVRTRCPAVRVATWGRPNRRTPDMCGKDAAERVSGRDRTQLAETLHVPVDQGGWQPPPLSDIDPLAVRAQARTASGRARYCSVISAGSRPRSLTAIPCLFAHFRTTAGWAR
jgi:hypothetical protein